VNISALVANIKKNKKMELKTYQEQTLDILSDFCIKIREKSVAEAFHGITGKNYLTTAAERNAVFLFACSDRRR
jgi:hypothetical protein